MHHSPSRSMAKASSANFGSCPLAVSVAVVTSDGGRISSNASALRSRASWQSARASVAPRPRCMVNIAPLILIARSLSRIPSAAPVSQCGTRWWSANSSGSPTGPVTTGLSARRRRRGRRRRAGWGSSAAARAARRRRRRGRRRALARRRRAAGSRPAAARPARRRPSRRSWPTCVDSSLTLARSSSRSAVSRRTRSSSGDRRVELLEHAPEQPRRASAVRTASGSVRSRRTSITGRRRYRLTSAAVGPVRSPPGPGRTPARTSS